MGPGLQMTDDEIRHLANKGLYPSEPLLLMTSTPIARIESYFTSRDLPYRIQLRDDRVEEFEPKLREQGHVEILPTPAMVLRKIPASPDFPDGVKIESVKGETALKAYRRMLRHTQRHERGRHSDRIMHHPDTALFLGRINGTPAATSLLIMTNQRESTWWPLRKPKGSEASVRRSLGRALRKADIKERHSRASAMGQTVCERMGFETISTYHSHASSGPDPEESFPS